MALLQCTCSYCDHLFYKITTPCEFTDGVGPVIACPVCSNTLLDTNNLTPEAPTECPGCSSTKGGSGCSGCSSGGSCGLKAALATAKTA